MPSSSQDGTPIAVDSPEEEEPLDADPPAAPVLLSAVLDGSAHEDIVISWSLSADDGAGDNDVSHYAVYFSQAYAYDGDGYSYLGKVTGGEMQFTHTMAGDGDWNNYFYFVQANDTSGNANWSGQAGKFVRYMEEGKQLASIPLIQDDTTLEVVLQTLKGSFKHVRYYKSSDQSNHWKSYWTFKTYRTLYEIDHRMGYWIDIKKADHLVVAGLVPEVTEIEMGHGWNLVGYPSFVERTISQALADADWKKAQGYSDVPPFHQKQLAGSDIMRGGEGYWIWVDLPQTLEVSNKPSEPPYIVWTDPADGEIDVPLNVSVIVKFSKEMNTSSVSWAISPDPGGYSEQWSEGNTLLEIGFDNPWPESVTITVEVISGEDLDGNPLVPGPVPDPWSFTTMSIVGPYIVLTDPYDGEVDIPVDHSAIVWFSEPMDITSVTWSTVPAITLQSLWSNDNTTLTLHHTTPFFECTRYEMELDGLDLDGNPLVPGPVPNPFSFETVCICIGPCIVETNPYDGERDIDIWRNITMEFSEPINSSSMIWTVNPDPGVWYEEWSTNNTVVVLRHANPLSQCVSYTIYVTYAEDMDGDSLVPGPVPNPWSFQTGCINPMIVSTTPPDGATGIALDAGIIVQFSKEIDRATFTWTIAPDPDPGGWTGSWKEPANDTVTLTHSNPFDEATKYLVEVLSADDLQGNPLLPGPVPNPWSFSTAPAGGPYIQMTDPANGERDVNISRNITIQFSKEIVPSTFYWNLTMGPDPGGWTESWSQKVHPNDTVTLGHNPFSPLTTYSIMIEHAKDRNGTDLTPRPFVFFFSTEGSGVYIVSVWPPDGQTNVSLTECILINFSEPMDTATVMFTINPPTPVTITWMKNNTMMQICPAPAWQECTLYVVQITEGRSLQGDQLVDGPVPNPFSFITVCINPYILFTDPYDGEMNVPVNRNITILFSEPMNPATLSFRCTPDPGGWIVSWNDNNTTVVLSHNDFQAGTAYTFEILYAEDMAGLPLEPGAVPNPFDFWT